MATGETTDPRDQELERLRAENARLRGQVAQFEGRVAQSVRAAYRGILIVVRRSRTLYPDETGWKLAGWLQWLWVFAARTAVLLVIRPSRDHDVPEEILGREWSGDMTHDGWSPYDFFKNAQHQQGLGHIRRRCKGILQVAPGGAVRFPRAVRRSPTARCSKAIAIPAGPEPRRSSLRSPGPASSGE